MMRMEWNWWGHGVGVGADEVVDGGMDEEEMMVMEMMRRRSGVWGRSLLGVAICIGEEVKVGVWNGVLSWSPPSVLFL